MPCPICILSSASLLLAYARCCINIEGRKLHHLLQPTFLIERLLEAIPASAGAVKKASFPRWLWKVNLRFRKEYCFSVN